MRYEIGNDLHIHSMLSLCSRDSEQSTDRILEYAEKYGIKNLRITDHFLDEDVARASDAHHPDGLERSPQKFEKAITLLGLTEDDKFYPFK